MSYNLKHLAVMENLFGPDDDDYPDMDDRINMGYGADTVEIDIDSDLSRDDPSLPTPSYNINIDAGLYPRDELEPSVVRGVRPPEVVDLGIDKEVVIKQKSTRAKLDDERLLSAEGLLTIKRRAPKVRFKGKGHEYRYLGRLLECYQIWGHQLFPKANFEDFLAMTEKRGRSKQMKVVRRQMIDEWKPVRPPEQNSDEENRANGLDQRQTYDDGTGFVVGAGYDDDENHDFASPKRQKATLSSDDYNTVSGEREAAQLNDDVFSPRTSTSNVPQSTNADVAPEHNPTPPVSDVPGDVRLPDETEDSAPTTRTSPSPHQDALFLFDDDDDDDDDLYD
ncbi:replication fork protection component Swi3-domain-containing protein [Lipomyces orientalis]|uniref:Replication fork protection component Swi3-domain-containing protein n=1 Tax=Lipomyces orientalis TaxID=1233043 RepID=A0ACC3TP59_9ASCO